MLQVVEKHYQVSDGLAYYRSVYEPDEKQTFPRVFRSKEGVSDICVFKRKGVRTAVASSTGRQQIEQNLRMSESGIILWKSSVK